MSRMIPLVMQVRPCDVNVSVSLNPCIGEEADLRVSDNCKPVWDTLNWDFFQALHVPNAFRELLLYNHSARCNHPTCRLTWLAKCITYA